MFILPRPPTCPFRVISGISLNHMILALSFIAGLITGLLVMRKHAAKASELEAKGKAALDALKGR